MKPSDLNTILPAETLAAGYRVVDLVGGPEFVTGYTWLPRLDFRKLTPDVAAQLVALRFPYLIQVQDRPAVPALKGDRAGKAKEPVAAPEGEHNPE